MYPELIDEKEREWELKRGTAMLDTRTMAIVSHERGRGWDFYHEMAHLKWSPMEGPVLPEEFKGDKVAQLFLMGVEDMRVNSLLARVARVRPTPTPAELDLGIKGLQVAQKATKTYYREVKRGDMPLTGAVLVAMGLSGWDAPVSREVPHYLPPELGRLVKEAAQRLWADGAPLDYQRTLEVTRWLYEEFWDSVVPEGEKIKRKGGKCPEGVETPMELDRGSEKKLEVKIVKGLGKKAADRLKMLESEGAFAEAADEEYSGGLGKVPPGLKQAAEEGNDGPLWNPQTGVNLVVEATSLRELLKRMREYGHDWGDAEVPLLKFPMQDNPRLAEVRDRRYTESGVHPLGMHRIGIDRKVFLTKKKRPQAKDVGSIAIDVSGSMHWSIDMFKRVMEMMPRANVIAYNSAGGKSRFILLAKDGKILTEESITKAWGKFGGGNGCDIQALWWLASNPEPRIWVSDGGICSDTDNGAEVDTPMGAGAAMQLCIANNIVQVKDGSELLTLLRNGTLPNFDVEIYSGGNWLVRREAWAIRWDK